jgi:protein-L-isoaspartate(D-aspartate) O-methyltransferase
MPAPSPPPDDNDRAFSPAELAVARRAYARQMTASLGVDNPAIEAAYAAAPLEAFLGPPPWTASSPFTGYRPLSGSDPVVLYQDLLIALDPARGVNNPPGAARQAHRGPRPEARRAHRPCRRRRGLL